MIVTNESGSIQVTPHHWWSIGMICVRRKLSQFVPSPLKRPDMLRNYDEFSIFSLQQQQTSTIIIVDVGVGSSQILWV